MNTIVRFIAVLGLTFALAACGSSNPTVAPSLVAASPSAPAISSAAPSASPTVSASPTASCDPAQYDPTYPGPGCGPKASYDMSKCNDPRWYPTPPNVFASGCGNPDLSKCAPALIFGSLCVVPGPLPADWVLTDQSSSAMWGSADVGGSLSWNPPDAVFCVSGPMLQIKFVRRDGISPNVAAGIAGGIASFAQAGWLPAGTKQTGSGNLTLGPWVGQFASYSCPGGSTTVTLFAATDGSSNTMFNAVSSTQAANEKSVSDFIAALSLQAGSN